MEHPIDGQSPPERSLPTDNWIPGDVIDEYWADLLAGRAPSPEVWQRSHGGGLKQSAQLQVLSVLHKAASSQAISSPASPTDEPPLSARDLPSDRPDDHPDEQPSPRKVVASLAPGELLDGKLRIMDLLGVGGMGEVYVAWHVALEREVAVKVLPRDMAGDEASVARFRKSIAAQAKTGSHSNIAAVMDAGWHDGQMYLVMEYVAGMDLEMLLRTRYPLPWQEVCDWMRQAARGLDHAHRAGLVHRDIKPSNLIRANDGTVKLLDWGLARARRGPSAKPNPGATEANVAMGTCDYIAPEQARDASSVDGRADLYSLGCSFYQLLAGRPPFWFHAAPMAKVAAHINETPPPLAGYRPDVPPSLGRTVDRLMEKDPSRRFPTAGDLAAQLDALLASPPASPTPERRKAWMAAIGVGLLVASVAVGYAAWRNVKDGAPQAGTSQADPSGTIVHWERLDLHVAPNVTDASQPYDPTYAAVKDGKRQPERAIRALAPQSGFKLEGRLSAAAPWAIAWIDTQGKFAVEAEGDSANVAYPATAHFATVNPDDPPGVHLILVLVASKENRGATADESRSRKLRGLSAQSFALPPDVPSGVWLNTVAEVGQESDWRAAGEQVEQHTQRSYLEQIQKLLPTGVKPQAAFFLRTAE